MKSWSEKKGGVLVKKVEQQKAKKGKRRKFFKGRRRQKKTGISQDLLFVFVFVFEKVVLRKGGRRRQAPAVAAKYTAGIYSPDIGNTDTG